MTSCFVNIYLIGKLLIIWTAITIAVSVTMNEVLGDVICGLGSDGGFQFGEWSNLLKYSFHNWFEISISIFVNSSLANVLFSVWTTFIVDVLEYGADSTIYSDKFQLNLLCQVDKSLMLKQEKCTVCIWQLLCLVCLG